MCQVCDHPQRAAIELDIHAGLAPSPVAKKYGLKHHAIVIQHERRHMHVNPAVFGIVDSEPLVKPAGIELTRVDEVSEPAVFDRVDSQVDYHGKIHRTWKEFQPAVLPMVPSNPLSQFQQAWNLAKDDDRMRAQMVQWLNEQLQADEMGL